MKKQIPLQVADEPASMYVSEQKIHPREIDGRFQRLRRIAVWVLLGMFYAFPWINWPTADGSRQSVLFDLPARKFYVFWLNFWPQDFVFLAMLLIIAGLSLFFFTALAGRLWCGYACPQTVWTEVFIWIEQWAEGDRNKRMKFDKSPWTAEKIRRRGGKHVLWLAFALWTGFTFVGFFTPIRELGDRFVPFEWGGWETFWVLFYALATWGNAGFLREQVCKYMCPYARFQSAMFDRNTLIIAYDPMRGEPRGPRKKGKLASVLERGRGLIEKSAAYDYVFRAAHHHTAADNLVAARGNTAIADPGLKAEPLPKFEPEELGDCVDCTICVQVCPTGIDIRNGLQYECIACGACIDACNEVMDKVGYPRGLIRYATQNEIDGKPSKVLRPRIFVYGILLLTLVIAWAWSVTHRSELIVEVLRDRNALYSEVRERVASEDGEEEDEEFVENHYTLKLINKTVGTKTYRIRIDGPRGIVLRIEHDVVTANAEEVLSLPLTLRAPEDEIEGRHEVRFVVEAVDGSARQEIPASFFGPK
jgi:polyferredoxin